MPGTRSAAIAAVKTNNSIRVTSRSPVWSRLPENNAKKHRMTFIPFKAVTTISNNPSCGYSSIDP